MSNVHPARAHFENVDPVLARLWQQVEQHQPQRSFLVTAREPSFFFSDLVESIASQQLSIKAADTIWKRVVALLPHQEVTPEHLLAISDDALRAAGLSWAKVKYVKNVAQAAVDGLDFVALPTVDNDTVIAELVKIKGVGRWTAEMFLIFTLGRPDVFSVGDLGLRNAVARWYQLEAGDLKGIAALAERWAPYRSYASRLLWRSLELPK